jgi:hypothetical protein
MKLLALVVFLAAGFHPVAAQQPPQRCHQKCVPVMTPQGVVWQCFEVCE